MSRRDLDFLLYEWLRVDELTKRERFAEHSRETFDGVLELCEQLATRYFAPHNKKSDAQEPSFDGSKVTIIPEVKEALTAFAKADLISMGMDKHLGGAQLPATVAQAGFALVLGGECQHHRIPDADHGQRQPARQVWQPNRSTASSSRCWPGGSPGRCACPNRRPGRRWPISSPRRTRTTAPIGCSDRRCGSRGDHELTDNIVHLVLAKIPGGPAGTKGISLFMVPKFLVDAGGNIGQRNDVVLAGLNHKMGFRGITNTVLNFGEGRFRPGGEPGAVGYLVGEPHRGITYMFHMMNEARLGVGMGASRSATPAISSRWSTRGSDRRAGR